MHDVCIVPPSFVAAAMACCYRQGAYGIVYLLPESQWGVVVLKAMMKTELIRKNVRTDGRTYIHTDRWMVG